MITTATGMPKYCIDAYNGFKKQLLSPHLQPTGRHVLYGQPTILTIEGSATAAAARTVLFEVESDGAATATLDAGEAPGITLAEPVSETASSGLSDPPDVRATLADEDDNDDDDDLAFFL